MSVVMRLEKLVQLVFLQQTSCVWYQPTEHPADISNYNIHKITLMDHS